MNPHARSIAAAGLLALSAAISAGGAPPHPGLQDRPMVAEAIGLRMHLPVGAVASAEVTENGIAYTVSDGDPPTWSMRITNLTPAVDHPTAESLIQGHLEAVQATGRPFTTLTNRPHVVGRAQGHLLTLELTLDDQKVLVNGWLVVPTSARSFIIFTLITSERAFAETLALLEASFSTIEIQSRAELLDERQARLERGRRIISTFTPEILHTAIRPRQWFRIYRPGGTGRVADDTEVGFLSVEVRSAPRGQLTAERSPTSYGAMEAELGLMVLIEARAIVTAGAQHYLDVDGRYWLSWNRATEAWSVRQTQRVGEASQTTAETGVRTGTTLNVIHSLREQLTRDPSLWSIPDPAYLSQVEVFVLGTLLPRDSSVTGSFAGYYYDSRSRRLTQRVDDWAPARDGTGHWLLNTHLILEVAAIAQRFDASGDRVQRIDGDGTVTLRIDPDDLRRLWTAKGLISR